MKKRIENKDILDKYIVKVSDKKKLSNNDINKMIREFSNKKNYPKIQEKNHEKPKEKIISHKVKHVVSFKRPIPIESKPKVIPLLKKPELKPIIKYVPKVIIRPEKHIEHKKEIKKKIIKKPISEKTKKYLLYVSIIILAILFISLAVYYSKDLIQPKSNIQLGPNVEKATVSTDGKLIYIKLPESASNNTEIRFIFKDSSGKEYDYTLNKDNQEFPTDPNNFQISLSKETIGIDNLNNINSIEVILKSAEPISLPIIPIKPPIIPNPVNNTNNKTINKTKTIIFGGSGGGGNNNPTQLCVLKTCTDIGKSCGSYDDGCGNQINCGTCDDEIACTVDSCSSDTGLCVHNTSSCQCSISNDPKCDDGNPCTIDDCNLSNKSCTYVPGNKDSVCRAASGQCDSPAICDGLSSICPANPFLPSGSACTGSDKCSLFACNALGICVGTPKSCDDSIACTVDTCDSSTGSCKHDASSCQCSIANDPKCDDGNPCTIDDCNLGTKTCTHVPGNKDTQCRSSTSQCNSPALCDGLSSTCPANPFLPINSACTGSDKCSLYACNALGVCVGTPKSCDDSIACTVDTCDSSTGSCKHDASSCQCSIANDPKCDDGNPCTIDDCNLNTKSCIHTPGNKETQCRSASGQCDSPALCDGLSSTCPANPFLPINSACTGIDKCSDFACNALGICVGTPKSCDDGIECTLDTCDSNTGSCTHDASKCECSVANDIKCDDGNPCTINDCNLGTKTCTHVPGNKDTQCRSASGQCDSPATCDGLSSTCPSNPFLPEKSSCTGTDLCSDFACNALGICVGTPKSCDDGITCTLDSCDSSTGSCTHDASKCECSIANDPKCDDGNPCTIDDCNLASKSCTHNPGNKDTQCRSSTSQCDSPAVCEGLSDTCPSNPFLPEKSSCTGSDLCSDFACNALGVCVGTPKSCDDGITCTLDSCDSNTGSCTHDASKCECSVAKDVKCNDGNPCTIDDCNLGTKSCTYTPGNKDTQCRSASGQCDSPATCDGLSADCPSNPFLPENSACTGSDLCSDFACNALGICVGTPKSCDDGNDCTADSCNSANGNCKNQKLPEGATCQVTGTCDHQGVCIGGAGSLSFLQDFMNKLRNALGI